MRTIALSECASGSVLVKATAVLYPRDAVASYDGEYFGLKPIEHCVQYQTCQELDEGKELTDTRYYGWTVEKINRLGKRYERFLFSGSKGCRIGSLALADAEILDDSERPHVLALAATREFAFLYESIRTGWDVRRTGKGRDIRFVKVGRSRCAVEEGRHRVAVLSYIHRNEAEVYFEIVGGRVVRRTWVKEALRWVRGMAARTASKCDEGDPTAFSRGPSRKSDTHR